MRHTFFPFSPYFLASFYAGKLGLGASAYGGGAEFLHAAASTRPQHVHQKKLPKLLLFFTLRVKPRRIFVHRAIRQLAAPKSEICRF